MKHMSHFKLFSILAVGLLSSCSEGQQGSSGSDMAKTMNSEKEVMTDVTTEDGSVKTVSEDVSQPDTQITAITRSADAHTHGDAELAIVLENENVTVEFDSPLYNILGFEHAPETDVQKMRVSSAETELSNGDNLFAFNTEAECISSSEIQDIALFNDQDTEMPSDHGHDHSHGEGTHKDDHSHDSENANKHSHAHKNDEAHKDHEHDEEHSDHKDILLTYNFTCKNSPALKNVSVNLFEVFENLSEIDVVYLGPSTQKQMTLNRNNSEMDLSQ